MIKIRKKVRKIRWDRVLLLIATFLCSVYQIISIVKAITFEEETTIENNNQVIELEEITVVEDNTLKSLGEFKITFYADCEQDQEEWVGQTSTGSVPTVGRTIAVDPKVIPYFTHVFIDTNNDGVLEEYVAEDCGGMIKNNHIDVLVETYEEGSERGIVYTEVFINE